MKTTNARATIKYEFSPVDIENLLKESVEVPEGYVITDVVLNIGITTVGFGTTERDIHQLKDGTVILRPKPIDTVVRREGLGRLASDVEK